jgi:16S rRNA (cytidine1402-2'-O)-methyltransferase
VTFFESPLRIARTLAEAAPMLGDRPISVARELTKLHQEILRGTCAELAALLVDAKGEITVVVGPLKEQEIGPAAVDERVIAAEFWSLARSGQLSRRAAVSELANKFRMPSREIYSIIERQKEYGG